MNKCVINNGRGNAESTILNDLESKIKNIVMNSFFARKTYKEIYHELQEFIPNHLAEKSVKTFEIDPDSDIPKLVNVYHDSLAAMPIIKTIVEKMDSEGGTKTEINFDSLISQAIKTKLSQQADDTVHNDQQVNLETTGSLEATKLNKEINLLFLDYAFRGMYVMRNEFESQFKKLIWESCFINRGTLRAMYPSRVQWSNVGAVSSSVQLNQNIKDLQESQYGVLVDFFKSKNIALAGDKLYDSITGGSTEAFDISELVIKRYFDTITTDTLLRARLSENEADKKLVEAYKAYVLLSNFDSYISMLFGKDIEIIPQNQIRFNGNLKYRLADRSHTNRTTHAEMDEIIVDNLINYIVKGGIETTPEYDRFTGDEKENLYLNYADFANIIGDIKAMANSAVSFLDITNLIPSNISEEAKNYLTKHKTLRACITNMKFDMQNNLRYVLELISNNDFQRNRAIDSLLKNFNYDTVKLDKLYSIYRGIFSNESDSLYNMDSDKNISSNFTQNAASIYTNTILQYYKDRNGKTKVRYLYDQDLDNTQLGIENTINSSHLIKLSSETHNLLSKIDKNKINNIDFSYAIPINKQVRIKVNTYAKSDTQKATFLLERKDAEGNWIPDAQGQLTSNKFLNKYYSEPNVQNSINNFITHELCVQIGDNNIVNQYMSIINSDKITALSELLNFANSICTNAIIKDEIFNGKFGNTNNEETLKKLQAVFGEGITNISKSGVSLIDNKYVPVLRRLSQAVQLSKNKNLSSIVKSGEGNAFSPYSLSRLLGGIAEQVETQCAKEGSATRNSAFVKEPGFFVGVAKQQEYYTYNRQGKQVKNFNTQEFAYGGFLYQYISGLIQKDIVSKDTFGNGVIGIIPTTNSDKGEMSVAMFNLRNHTITDQNGIQHTLLDILNDNRLMPAQKRQILYDDICKEIGTQYYTVAANIHQDFVNQKDGFFTVINKYLRNHGYTGSIFKIDQRYDYLLGDFSPFKSWFQENYDELKQIGIYDHKDLFDKSILWYNTETSEGYAKPVELYDLVSCEFNKSSAGNSDSDFRSISANETLVSLLYRFNPQTFDERNAKLGEDKRQIERYYNINDFFDYKNKKTLYDLLKNNFTVDLSCTFIANSDNPTLKRIRLNNPELFEIKKRLDSITDQKWYNSKSGNMVLAKYISTENGTQVIHDIYSIVDYEKYINLDQTSFLRSPNQIILNPLIEQYNLIDYLCSSEYTHCTVGSLIAHIAKGKITKANNDRERILARESLSYLAQTKRNVSLTAQMEEFQLGTITGIPTRLNIALIQDIYTGVWNNLGMTDKAKPFDGGTFANPFQVYWENNSLSSARVGKTKKPYAHYYNERMMCAGMLKTASFPLTNEICRTSKMYKNLLRMSTDIKWRNPDGSIWQGDITKSALNNNQNIISDSGNIFDSACYIKEGDKFYNIGLEYTGNNTYNIIKNQVSQFGSIIKKRAEVQSEVVIDSNYKLWQVLGGENSYSTNSFGLLVPSEQSIVLIAELANNIGVIKTQLDQNDNSLDWVKVSNGYMYQVLKQANIHLLPTEGVVKMFQCNMNSNSVYNDPNAKLNYSKIITSQYGIQLDKEHNADDAELSMMTQVMNACAFRGFTFDIAKSLYSSLYHLNRLGVHDFLEPFERMMRSQDDALEQAASDFYSAINKSLIKTLANRAGKTDRAKQYAQKILDKARGGEKIDYATLEIPFSSKSIYRQTVSSIASILTKQGIKHKIDGTLSVLSPSYNAILIYGNGSLKGFDDDAQLAEFQSKICEANPAYDIEQNGDVKITPVIISAHNAENEIVSVDAMRYSIDGIDGYVDLAYNFMTKEYDVILNMNLNSLSDEYKQQIISLISNAVPIGSDIRFAQGNEINQENLSSYRLFKQFGFYDVKSTDEQFRHKVNKEIPNMRRMEYATDSSDAKDKEQTKAASEAEEFDKHFDSKTSGKTKQIWSSIASNSNSDIVFVFTNDEHQQSIAKLKRDKGDKIHIINVSDSSFSSNDFAEKVKDEINQAITGIETKAKQTIAISILGDDITKMQNKFINQSNYNKLILQIINGLTHDKKISIVSDGQSGFGYAAIMAAKHNNKGWKVINGGDWTYRERVFVFDNRPASERWTNDPQVKEKDSNVQEITNNEKTPFYQALPKNAEFAAGTLLPDNLFNILKDQLVSDYQYSLERYNENLQIYFEKKSEYDKKVEKHKKWEENGKEGKEPRVGKAPQRPSLEYVKLGSLQDISGKSIQDILNIYIRSKSTDEKQFTIFDFDENDYQNVLKPLYELWAYQNPKIILKWKRKCAENTDMKLYDPHNDSFNIARVVGELLENVSWAYKYDNYHLNPRGNDETVNSALQISNKYIGADPIAIDTKYRSAAIAMAQDEDVVNSEYYEKGDIAFLRTIEHLAQESADNSNKVDQQNEEIMQRGKNALDQNAVLIIDPHDSICNTDQKKSKEENIEDAFDGSVFVEHLVVNDKTLFIASNDKNNIDILFSKIDRKIGLFDNGQQWLIDDSVYVPSSLFRSLQKANNQIRLSTHSTQELFNIFDICSNIKLGKFDGIKQDWDIVSASGDPVLYKIDLGTGKSSYCFGRKQVVDMLNNLYDVKTIITGAYLSKTGIDIDDSVVNNLNISDKIKRKLNGLLPIIKDTAKPTSERQDAYDKAVRELEKLIRIEEQKVKYISGDNSIESEIGIQNSRIKDTHVDPEVSMAYTNIIKGQVDFQSRFVNDIDLSDTTSLNSGNIISSGLEYNELQSEAIRQSIKLISEHLGEADKLAKTILIDGSAGTGKTSTIDAILKNLDPQISNGSYLIVSALSNKSKNNLDNSLSPSIKNGKYQSYQSLSIAKMLGLKQKNGVYDFSTVAQNAPIRNADIVVIDDIQMLDRQQIDTIRNNMKRGAVLFLIGDKNQIGHADNISFKPDKEFVLNKNIRQGDNNPIVDSAEKFLSDFNSDIQSSQSETGAVIVSGREILNKYFDTWNKAVELQDPSFVKIITQTRNQANAINKTIHDSLCAYIGQDKNAFYSGELIISKQNAIAIDNSEECIITSIERPSQETYNSITFNVQNITVKTQNGRTLNLRVIPDLCFNSTIDKQKIADYMRKNNIVDIDLSYADTIGRVQGSIYDIAYIDYDDVAQVKDNKLSQADKGKTLYTALTRVKNVAVIANKGKEEYDQNIIDVNDNISKNKNSQRLSQEYNVKGLEKFHQNADGSMIVVFDSSDGTDKFDFRKGDTLYDINDIRYDIIEDPIIYNVVNADQISQIFGGDIPVSTVSGNVVVKVKPANNVNVKEIAQSKLAEQINGFEFDTNKIKSIDTTKIKIGFEYFVTPNCWHYTDDTTAYNGFKITHVNSSDAISVDGDHININTKKVEQQFNRLNQNTRDKFKTLNDYIEYSIYKEVSKYLSPTMSKQQLDQKAMSMLERSMPYITQIKNISDYIKLTDQIRKGLIKRVVQNAAFGRDLATINYIFEDVNGNKFQLADLDSIRNIYELRDIQKEFKKGDKTKACDQLKNLFRDKLGINFKSIDEEQFDALFNRADKILRREQQFDFRALSKNSTDLVDDFRRLCNSNNITQDFCQRVIDWVNYSIGNFGQTTLKINGKTIQLTPQNFRSNARLIEYVLQNRSTVKINGQKVGVNKGTIECEPYEVVMPKVMATVYGLKAGDQVNDILNSYESDTFKNNISPSDSADYLGFFGRRLLQNWNSKLLNTDYDLCLKNITGNHVYIISKDRIEQLKNKFKPARYNIRTDIHGNKIVVNPDGTDKIQIGQNDTIYLDEFGCEVIATDNPKLYLDNLKYSYITFGKEALQNSDIANKYIDDILFVAEEGTNEQLSKIIDELVDEDGTLDKNNVFLYFKNMSEKPEKIYEKFRKEGMKIYASFKTSLDIIASRIPAQCQHSFMPMRVVGFVDSDVNNAYVSVDQIWLQGSDYDIDTVSLASYSIDPGGKLYLWSPYAKYDTYEQIQKSRRLPVPSGKEYVVSDGSRISTEDSEYIKPANNIELVLEFFNKYRHLFKRSKKQMFVMNPNAKLEDIAKLLNEKPIIYNPEGDAYNILQQELINAGLINKVNEKDIINRYNQALLSIFNKHNSYIKNVRSPHIQKLISNNITISAMIETSQDAQNMIESRTPIDSCKDEWTSIAETSSNNDIEYRQPGSFSLKANGIVENQIGKDCISIAAVGLKALSAIQYYYNQILNMDQDPMQNNLFFNIEINGQHYDLPIDIRPKSASTLTASMLRKLVAAVNDTDPALAFSALLSLSVDNAKDLSLAKLNANPATMGMYLFGLTIGVPVDTLTSIMMGPIGDMFIEIMKTNSFTKSNDSFDRIGGILYYLDKGLFNILKEQYNTIMANGNKQVLTAYENLCKIAARLSGYDENVNIFTAEDVFKNDFKKAGTFAARINYLDKLQSKCDELFQGNSNDYTAQMYQIIDQMRNYARYKQIISENSQAFKDFTVLQKGAEEMKTLGRILSLNQGLKNKEDEADRMLIMLQEALGDIDLEAFAFNQEVRQKAIDKYEKEKVAFNILGIIANKEDVFGFIKDLVIARKGSDRAAKYKFGLNNYASVKRGLGLKNPDTDVIKGLRTFYDDMVMNDFIKSKHFNLEINKGTTIFGKDGKPTKAEDNMVITLGNEWNNATFINWFNTVFMPGMKESYGGNRFIADLSPYSTNKTTDKNDIIYYALPAVNMSPREDSEQVLFDNYSSTFNELKSATYNNIPVHDIFAYYNIIAQHRTIGEKTMTKFLDAADSGIINELESYIASRDAANENLTVGNFQGADIKLSEVLPYVVPMFYSSGGNRGDYARYRNPFTGQYEIIKKKPDLRYDDEYDLDNFDDVIDDIDDGYRNPYPEGWNSYSGRKINNTYFSESIYNSAENVNYKYKINNQDVNVKITYSKDANEFGYHRIYSVVVNDSVFNGQRIRFKYNRIKVEFGVNRIPNITFDEINTASTIENDKEFFKLDSEHQDKNQRINLGVRKVQGNDDIAFWPDVIIKFQGDKITQLNLSIGDKVVELDPSELSDGRQPIISNNKIPREILEKIIEAYDQKKQNGCE